MSWEEWLTFTHKLQDYYLYYSHCRNVSGGRDCCALGLLKKSCVHWPLWPWCCAVCRSAHRNIPTHIDLGFTKENSTVSASPAASSFYLQNCMHLSLALSLFLHPVKCADSIRTKDCGWHHSVSYHPIQGYVINNEPPSVKLRQGI